MHPALQLILACVVIIGGLALFFSLDSWIKRRRRARRDALRGAGR